MSAWVLANVDTDYDLVLIVNKFRQMVGSRPTELREDEPKILEACVRKATTKQSMVQRACMVLKGATAKTMKMVAPYQTRARTTDYPATKHRYETPTGC